MLFRNEVAQETGSNSPSHVVAVSGLKILIADDHALIREGLKVSVKQVAQNVAVLEADTLDSAIATYRASPAIDLVLLDLSMAAAQGSSALDAFAENCPEARIVIVSATCDMPSVQAAIAKGVLGFIPKCAGMAAIVNALRFVLEGGIYIPAEAFLHLPSSAAASGAGLMSGVERKPATQVPAAQPRAARAIGAPYTAKLTARQIDVLEQLLDGKPNKQICRELNLALGTVKCHVGAILGALEVNSRAEAIAAADKNGWRQWVTKPRMDNRQLA